MMDRIHGFRFLTIILFSNLLLLVHRICKIPKLAIALGMKMI
jgi:hypothetical protein